MSEVTETQAPEAPPVVAPTSEAPVAPTVTPKAPKAAKATKPAPAVGGSSGDLPIKEGAARGAYVTASGAVVAYL